MAAGRTDILPKAVEFVLDNWTVLQLAVQHGFGGADSCLKVFWFKEVIVQVLTDNQKVDCEELVDYISEILYNEFDTVVEDGSLEKISQKLCQFQSLWRAGNIENIEQEIQIIGPVKLKESDKVEDKEPDEDMEEPLECSQPSTSEATNSRSSCIQCVNIQEGIGNLSIAPNSQQSPQTVKEMKNDQEEEGWEVVRRSKKR